MCYLQIGVGKRVQRKVMRLMTRGISKHLIIIIESYERISAELNKQRRSLDDDISEES